MSGPHARLERTGRSLTPTVAGSRPMGRRTLLAMLAGGLLAVPLALEAQQAGNVRRIGVLSAVPPSTPEGQGALNARMRELGWVYGRDFVTERRVYGWQLVRVPDLARELIRTGVDIFVVSGASEAVLVQQLTRTIPIVTVAAGDLVEAGLAANLARPGGNVTGIQILQPELGAKHVSLLKEAIPRLSRLGVLLEGSSPSLPARGISAALLRETEAGGKALGIALQIVTVTGAGELEAAFSALQVKQAQAAIVVRHPFMFLHQKTVVDLALKHRLPTISDLPEFATQGGLMSYGFKVVDVQRAAAEIVDKILRGAKASEIPIRQPTTFQLVINLKTANTLGLTLPQSLLGRADEVIR